MSAFTRTEFNDLIDSVNAVLQNPIGSCDPIAPLEHVGENHRWSKGDIAAVQNAIKQTCDQISFDDIPDLWKKRTLDEISEKLGQAWCDCGCPTAEAVAQDGLEATLLVPGHLVYANFADPGPPYPLGSWNVAEHIEGYALAIPGFRFRSWTFTAEVGPQILYQRSGEVRCDGTCNSSPFVDPEDSLGETVVQIVAGACVFPDPDTGGPTPSCQAVLDEVNSYVPRYYLRLSSVLSECCD